MRTPWLLNCTGCGVILLFLVQCQKVSPQPPKAEGFDPAISATDSYVAGSLTLPLSELQAKINKELDPVLIGKGADKGNKTSMLPFSVIRSGPVQVQYINQQVRISAPLQVQLTKLFTSKANSPKKKPFCAMRVNFSSPVKLTPAWRLSTHIKFIDFQWEVKPEIKLLGKEISLANFARRLIQNHQSAIESAIDSAVYRDLRLDRIVSPIWRDVQKPLRLNKQYGLWLLPKPSGIVTSDIRGNARTITVPLLITVRPQTALSPQKPVSSPVALPALQKRSQLPQQSDLRLLSFVPYAAINQITARLMRDKAVDLAFGGLTVKQASVYGGQRSVIVKATVTGLVDGTLYLLGRPEFDTTTNTLRITNLDFDAQTQGALSSVSSQVVHKALQTILAKFLTISLGEELDQLPQKLNQAYEKSGAGKKTNLAIRSFRLVPQRIAVRPDGIQTLIDLKSNVALQVQHL